MNQVEITDDGTKPYNLSYSWKFTVRYDVDTSQVFDSTVSQAASMSIPSYGIAPPAGLLGTVNAQTAIQQAAFNNKGT